MFCPDLSRKHLVETDVGVVHQSLCRRHDLGAFQKRRGHLHHPFCHIEHDGSLLPVRSRAVDLCRRFSVSVQKIQRHRSGKLALSVLLGDLHIGRAELPGAVLLHDPEHIPYDLFLPGKQPERFPAPPALGVAKVFDKSDRPVCFALVIVGFREHEPGWLVVLQFRVVLRSLLRHQFPPSRSSMSSSGTFFRSAPAVILLLAEGVRPNCSAILFMILRYVWAMDTCGTCCQ